MFRKSKRVCSYIARYPVLGTVQSNLYFTPWQTCSFRNHLDFSGKHSATLQLLCKDFSFRYGFFRYPLSVAKYSFKIKFLYSAVSSPWDCSKRFTLHPQADLFIPRPFQFLWEVFSNVAINARRLFVHVSTTVCIARYSFIQLSELWQRGVIKLAKGSKRPQWDLKPGSLDSESSILTSLLSHPNFFYS